ncbi:MAG: NADH-quinone oxidoreductase subunit J [Planctomycetota bacterium]
MYEFAAPIKLIHPFLLYAACAVGAIGVWLALPRKKVNPQLLGGAIAGFAVGLVLLGLGIGAFQNQPEMDNPPTMLPSIYFYIFAAIALAASLRMITHPRPVYAALYFILTILSSCGLYLILSAEFMAFALVIIYAGAILITYLFVIMLATQAPSEEQPDALSDYDASAREPAIASGVGFVLLALLTTMLFEGVRVLDRRDEANPKGGQLAFQTTAEADVLARLPGKVEKSLRREGLITDEQSIQRNEETGRAMIFPDARTVLVEPSSEEGEPFDLLDWPESLEATNTEMVGFDLLANQPGSIEIAGVILLMAMLGATVLSRRQVEVDEELKAKQAAALPVVHTSAADGGGS